MKLEESCFWYKGFRFNIIHKENELEFEIVKFMYSDDDKITIVIK